MGNRSWIWKGAILLGAGLLFWAVGQAVNPSDGDAEFQRSLEAMKQVKTFRGSFIENEAGSHSERIWEVDCNRVVVHQQSQESSGSPYEMKEDELLVGEVRFTRDSGGSWQNTGEVGPRGSAKWYCDNIAQGTVRDLLPDMITMTHHAMTEKGDKKTVSGVRCREWKFALKSALNTQTGSICLGLDDHLPYEFAMENSGHFTYSDYNTPIQLDVPDATVQPASTTQEQD